MGNLEQELKQIPRISTGQPSTLKTYREIAFALGGFKDNKATSFLDEKIKTAKEGENAEVIQEEGQMIMLLINIIQES